MGFLISILFLAVMCAGYIASVSVFGLLVGSIAWVIVAMVAGNIVWKLSVSD